MSAVVTHQSVICRMIGQTDAAARSLGNMTALAAGYHSVGSTAVQEENGLLSPIQIGLEFLFQRAAERLCIAATKLVLHIGDDDLG